MPDITMCDGKNCPWKETCYRYIAEPSRWQSYFNDSPYDSKLEICEQYDKADFNELRQYQLRKYKETRNKHE